MSSKKLMFVGGLTLTVLVIVGLGWFLASQLLFNGATNLTADEKTKILASVIKNNSSSLLGPNNDSASLASLAGGADMESSLSSRLYYPEFERDYTYKYTNVNYTTGSAIGLCKQFSSLTNQPSVTESYEFFDESESYYKNISYNSIGILTDYYLSTNTSNSSETIEYKGGSYAIRWNYDYSDVMPMIEPAIDSDTSLEITEPESLDTPVDNLSEPTVPSDTDLISMYFGEDADIVGTTNINNREHYIIQYSYKTNCNQDIYYPLYDVAVVSNDIELNDLIIVQNVVDPETFEIVRNSNYLTSVAESNLLSSYSSNITKSNQSFAEVTNDFVFDYSVEVRDYSFPTYDYTQEAINLVNYLRSSNLTLITLPYDLSYAYSTTAYENLYSGSDYLKDRNFYPVGSVGDELFQLYNPTDQYTYSYLNLNYLLESDYSKTVSIDVYENNVDIESILGLTSVSDLVTTDINTSVNGEFVSATLYEYTPDISIYAEESKERDLSLIAPTSIRYLSFTYSNFKYVVYISSADIDLTTLDFSSIDTNNASQFNDFGNEIINAFNNNNVLRVDEGQSSPGSEGSSN